MSSHAKLVELIKDIRVAMLTTFTSGGRPHARPMYTQTLDEKTFDGVLWFMAAAGSKKIDELALNDEVLLTYSDAGHNRYVVVSGHGRAERNPEIARELWNIHAKGWYPDGPDDPNLRLIRVEVSEAEYWDGPSNTSYMLSLLKAVATGKRVETSSDHGVLRS